MCPYFDKTDEGTVEGVLFKLGNMSSEEAKRQCMENSPDLASDFASFEEYHRVYRSHDDTDHGDSKYPCIVSNLDDDWLLDGWHRFHSYIAKGDVDIPLMWYK